MEEGNDLAESLIATLRSDDAVSIATDASELAIDAVLEDGVLKAVPIVGTLVSLANIGFTVRDRLFVSKLVKFLSGLQYLSSDERKEMTDKLEADPEYGRKVGEHLIEILERLDAHRKPYMTAKVFSTYVSGGIDARTLPRLNYTIERIPFYEIDAVRDAYEKWKALKEKDGEGGIGVNIATLQALHTVDLMSAASGWGCLVYEPNDLCEVFLNLDLDKTKH